LIAAYHETFKALEQLPAVFWVPWGRGTVGQAIRLPRLRGGCRYFLIPHVGARLDELARRMNERLALEPEDAAAKADLDRISRYRAALAQPPFKRLLAVYTLLAAGVAILLGAILFPGLEIGHRITDFESNLVTLNLVKAFDSARDDPVNSVLALLLIGSALAVIVAPLIAAFRLKRGLLCCYPDAVERLRHSYASDTSAIVGGLYGLEASAFSEAGLKRPGEFPYDLALYSLRMLILLPLWIGLAFAAAGRVVGLALPHVPHWTVSVVLVGFVALAPWRIHHLVLVYRKRHGYSTPPSPTGFVAARTGPRVIAACLDVVFAIVAGFVLGMLLTAVPMNPTLGGLLILFVLFPAGGVLLALIAHQRGRQTLGKRLTGIEVVGLADQARPRTRAVLRREMVKWFLEIGPSLILLLPILFTIVATLRDPADRAFHDRLAGTAVRDRPAAQPAAANTGDALGVLETRPA
jgi:uncharacterized RDD family membrane protein YckC